MIEQGQKQIFASTSQMPAKPRQTNQLTLPSWSVDVMVLLFGQTGEQIFCSINRD